MKSTIVKSYAKINIALNVLGKKEDGYHELDMVMLPLKLHDSLLIEELPNKKDNFVVMDDFSYYVGHNNIVNKAINELDKHVSLCGTKFKVLIHKNIPMQAGMGGGSSNAAATLNGINEIKKLGVPKDKLLEISKPLGCDVPFFIDCVPARCTGVGDVITPIKVKNNYYVLIVKPEGGCSTKTVYGLFDENPNYKACNIEDVIKALETGDDDLLANSIGNSLQDVSIGLVPEIGRIIKEIKSYGIKICMMTGSGSAVFGLSTDKKIIKTAARILENRYNVEVTEVLK